MLTFSCCGIFILFLVVSSVVGDDHGSVGGVSDHKKELLEKLDAYVDDLMMKRLRQVLLSRDQANSTCVDVETVCEQWKAAGGCSHRELMRKYCAKTCDLCKAPSPPLPKIPDCARTKFGCCWNNQTAANGPTSNLALSGCSPCLDSQSKRFCNNWKSDCTSTIQGQGDVMRLKCPQTCSVPCDANMNSNLCRDHESKEKCHEWSEDGKCQNNPTDMKALCSATCKFCVSTTK